jgi:hydroxyethylthiazole kinase-like uncharacterized protein yjeF
MTVRSSKGEIFLTAVNVRDWLPPRPLASNKGKNGHVLIVAGSRGMSGAAILSAAGALRAGAGLVTVATPSSQVPVVAASLPEVLTLPLPESVSGTLAAGAVAILQAYWAEHQIHVLALGPGLSQREEVPGVVQALLSSSPMPVVLDADGLNNVSPEQLPSHGRLIVTPHPGEFSRLFAVEKGELQHERARLAQEAAQTYHLVCVLKGHHTVISDGKTVFTNPTGNPAMAAGGMGDVLTGIIAGLVGQGIDLLKAASAGVYLHGLAADIAAESDRGLLASEVAAALPSALRKIGVRR